MLISWGLLLICDQIISVIVCGVKRNKAFRLSEKNCCMEFVPTSYFRELSICFDLLLTKKEGGDVKLILG